MLLNISSIALIFCGYFIHFFHLKVDFFLGLLFLCCSIAEDKVIYPAVYAQISNFQERKNEESLSHEFRCLIESIKSAGTISSTAAEFHSKICSHADQIMGTLKVHFHDEEVKVSKLSLLIRKFLVGVFGYFWTVMQHISYYMNQYND